jgi:hypothetical protein
MFRRGDSNTKANLSAASAHSGGSGGASAAAPAKQKFSISETGDENVFNDEAQVAEDLSPEDQQLVKALAEGAYHLPGYTFWQDWNQYFNNTHPLFGICFHHPLHPTGWGMRLLCFTASIVFGLVITNIVWLWSETQEDSVVFAVDVGDQVSQNSNLTQYLVDINSNNQVEVTKDMIILWTAGGAMRTCLQNNTRFNCISHPFSPPLLLQMVSLTTSSGLLRRVRVVPQARNGSICASTNVMAWEC